MSMIFYGWRVADLHWFAARDELLVRWPHHHPIGRATVPTAANLESHLRAYEAARAASGGGLASFELLEGERRVAREAFVQGSLDFNHRLQVFEFEGFRILRPTGTRSWDVMDAVVRHHRRRPPLRRYLRSFVYDNRSDYPLYWRRRLPVLNAIDPMIERGQYLMLDLYTYEQWDRALWTLHGEAMARRATRRSPI